MNYIYDIFIIHLLLLQIATHFIDIREMRSSHVKKFELRLKYKIQIYDNYKE